MCSDVPARYVLLSMLFFGSFNIPLLRYNLGIAIVSMVNTSSTNNSSRLSYDSCSNSDNSTTENIEKFGSFEWNTVKQGLALGCYFYGFVCTPILGPWAAKKVGFKIVVGAAVALSSILTILIPYAAYGGFVYFVTLRIIIGFCQGAVGPSSVAAFSAWIPFQHKTTAISIVMCGFFLGAFAALPISALISEYVNWETVFYVTGSFSLLWSILWFSLVYNSPEQHPRITKKEKKYLLRNTSIINENDKKEQNIPWLRIMTSLPFLATVITHISFDWTLTMTSLVLPTYLTNTLNLGILAAGASTGAPWLMMMVITLIGERISNVLKRKKTFSMITIRKGLVATVTLPSAIFFILASYTGCNQQLTILLFFLIISLQGLHIPGTEANVFDLSNRYSSILFGILVTTSHLTGILAPQLTGVLLHNENSIGGWRTIFFITAGINILAAITFCIFASDKEQPWSKKDTNTSVDNEAHDKPLTKRRHSSQQDDSPV
ncbi:sialin-like [Styela clava]